MLLYSELRDSFLLIAIFFSLFALGTASADQKTRVDGQVLDCWNDRAIAVPNVDVFVFQTTNATRLSAMLNTLDRLAADGRTQEFIATYNQLEAFVKSNKKSWVARAKTDAEGKVSLNIPATGEFEILAISFYVEDHLSYYAHGSILQGQRSIKLWIDRGTCGEK